MMKFQDLLKLYDTYKERHGDKVSAHVSQLL